MGMTQEERVNCALSLEEPDRVPLFDLVDNAAVIAHYAGQQLSLENAAEVIPLALSRALDLTRVWLPSAPGKRVDEQGFTYERVSWFNEWLVDVPFRTMEELVCFAEGEIERLESWTPPSPVEQEREHAERLCWKSKYRGTVLPATGASEALQEVYTRIGLDWFVYLEAEYPDLVSRWLEANHARTMRDLESERNCRDISAIAWISGDIAYKGRLMFSPTYLREHGLFRHIAEMCEVWHSGGLKVVYHSDGYIWPVIPELIDAGVDALTPIEVGAGLDLESLKENFGHQVAFIGGIDVENVLNRGTVDDVRQATLHALTVAGPGGGLILGSSSEELFDALPAQNVITMIETCKECGRYPIGKYFPKHAR